MKLINHVKFVAGQWQSWLLLIVAVELLVIDTNLIPPGRNKSSGNEIDLVKYFSGANQTKTILIWNSAHRIETSAFGTGSEAFVANKCPVFDCRIVVNRTSLKFYEYDAVLFHIHEMEVTRLPEELDFKRYAHQRFVMLTQESPLSMSTFKREEFRDYFNWTMSYRLDSDVHLLYGRVSRKPSAPQTPEEAEHLIRSTHRSARNYAANKTKAVAWMVSHCSTYSLRENYVNELRKFIDVDVYGECGHLTCARNATHWLSEPHCYDLLSTEYKFYLSFENSLCTDYVTEKFFEILTHDMVPVVYGAANYSAIAPRHSFINAMNLAPIELADYLHRLDSNDTLYNEYFWWKDHYQVESGVDQMARHGFCDLCRKLHQDRRVKIHHEMQSTWSPLTQCVNLAVPVASSTQI